MTRKKRATIPLAQSLVFTGTTLDDLVAGAVSEARASVALDGETQCGHTCRTCGHLYNDIHDACDECGTKKGTEG